jgi:phosphatidylethanolamine-binding protein (PEBP) family uncharacterized protein
VFTLTAVLKGKSSETVLLSVKTEEERSRWCDAFMEVIKGVLITHEHLFSLPFRNLSPLKVTYSETIDADNSVSLLPEEVCTIPKVQFYGLEGSLYTLVMFDLDYPSRHDPSERKHVHWMVVNIPSSGTLTYADSGLTVLPYLVVAPFHGSGLHRYVFLLFEQNVILDEGQITTLKAFNRKKADIDNLALTYNLGSPIGINVFESQWTSFVDTFHEQDSFLPPTEYLSPYQRSTRDSLLIVEATEESVERTSCSFFCFPDETEDVVSK